MLVLHGSRARADDHDRSDWDLGYLADPGLDHLGLLAGVTAALRTDAVELVDLPGGSGLLRFRRARDGRALYEREPGTFERFVVAAALHWCDIEPVVRRAHQALLADLG
jgi:predicted nucleotidyltransferase